jgi:hypothetical protein
MDREWKKTVVLQLKPDAVPAAEPTTGSHPSKKHARYAVIPSNGRDCLKDCVDAIMPQVDKVIIINTTQVADSDGRGFFDFPMRSDYLDQFYAPTGIINISTWWNLGLEAAESHAYRKNRYKRWQADTWDVAIVNDDAIVPDGWFDAVVGGMRTFEATAGCSGNHTLVQRTPGPVPLDQRMFGPAFILAGQRRLKTDERFGWYCGDDDLDWRAREAGGMAMVSGFPVTHLYPNGQVTPEMQEQIARDMQYFVDKWGQRPW